MIELSNEQWAQAACVGQDVELFFPEGAKGMSLKIDTAKSICRGCPIKFDCLAMALENNEQGIWGGTTDMERTVMRRRTTRAVNLRLK